MLSLLGSLPAWAQDAPEDSLPAVTVTGTAARDKVRAPGLATGVAESSLDTPFSASSVAAERIREQAATTLQDALRNVPGAQADAGFNGSHSQFFVLRGAIADSGTGASRVLRDGVRLSNYPYVPAFVERVDVLRGPGAAAGVRSEPGGTVSLATHQPRLANFGSVHLGAGSAAAQESAFDLNRMLSQEDEWAARITATHSHASEWRHVPDRLGGLKLGLAKSDGGRYRLRAGAEATDQTYRPDYGVPALEGRPAQIPRDRQLGEPFGDSTTRNRIFDLHGDFALGEDARLSFAATHLEARSTAIRNVLTGAPLPGRPHGSFGRTTIWEPGTARRIDSLSTALTRWQSAGDTAHQIHVGADFYREALHQPSLAVPAPGGGAIHVFDPVFGQIPAPAPGMPLPRTLTTQDLQAVGITAQDKVDFGAWSLVAGVRWDRQAFAYGGPGVRPAQERRWSPKLALLHRASESDTFYANLATGIAPNQVASSSGQSLPSRRSAQFEIGWKSLWRGGALASELAAYRLDQSHMASADLSTPQNPFDFTSGGSARSQGVEASLSGALSARWSVAATYAFTDAAYRQNALHAGKRIPNVARHALSVWGHYRWNAAWKTGIGVHAQSRRFADEGNTTTLPGHARLDLVQTWTHRWDQGRSLDLQLALRNLLDAQYYVASHLHVTRWITPGQGRHVALSATYRF